MSCVCSKFLTPLMYGDSLHAKTKDKSWHDPRCLLFFIGDLSFRLSPVEILTKSKIE